ncbi:radical SAM protein [Xanthomonas bonasiae]|uniref:radical SAM protein n=1 Tax=Xanthomonas bonasiae TaxID=2810351 RepID=UPI001786C6CD|nr:radical SAM protein [Xanthomonas surreyensis]MBD7922487.1 radical SAM protein [Xanthomonas surreyensis]
MPPIFRPKSTLGIVFKISERCNLKCEYCYFFFGGDDTWQKRQPLVSDDVIHALARFSTLCAKSYNLNHINISFHGGEPLLMPKSRFDSMCNILRSYEDGFQFQFHLQTNGALVDDEWVKLLAHHRIGVGISLDGTKAQNDIFRLDKRGRSSYDKTLTGLRLIQQGASDGIGIQPGLLCVINPTQNGEETFSHLADLNASRMNFLVPDYSHDSGKPKEYVDGVGAYLRSVTRAWARSRRPAVKIRFLQQLITLMASREDSMRSMIPHDFRHLIVVSSDGKIGPEDTLHSLADRFRNMQLTVFNAEPEDVFTSPVWVELEEALYGPTACKACEWRRVCRGGNPANRFSSSNGFNNPSIYCTQLKLLYQDVRGMLEKNSVPPEIIDQNLECTA